jgi:hypothetical protein
MNDLTTPHFSRALAQLVVTYQYCSNQIHIIQTSFQRKNKKIAPDLA